MSLEDLKRGRRNESALAIQPENPSASDGDYYDGLDGLVVVGGGGIGDDAAGGGGGGGSSLTAPLASAGVVCSLLAAVALLTAFNAKKRRRRGGEGRLWPATATESSNRLVGT